MKEFASHRPTFFEQHWKIYLAVALSVAALGAGVGIGTLFWVGIDTAWTWVRQGSMGISMLLAGSFFLGLAGSAVGIVTLGLICISKLAQYLERKTALQKPESSQGIEKTDTPVSEWRRRRLGRAFQISGDGFIFSFGLFSWGRRYLVTAEQKEAIIRNARQLRLESIICFAFWVIPTCLSLGAAVIGEKRIGAAFDALVSFVGPVIGVLVLSVMGLLIIASHTIVPLAMIAILLLRRRKFWQVLAAAQKLG